jgi:hypothetical protein
VIVYGLLVPVFSPLGVVMLNCSNRSVVLQAHSADCGLIPGPARVASTLPALASAATVLAAIGRSALSVSANLTDRRPRPHQRAPGQRRAEPAEPMADGVRTTGRGGLSVGVAFYGFFPHRLFGRAGQARPRTTTGPRPAGLRSVEGPGGVRLPPGRAPGSALARSGRPHPRWPTAAAPGPAVSSSRSPFGLVIRRGPCRPSASAARRR